MVMREADRVTCDAADRRESGVIEGSYKPYEFWGARGQRIDLIGVTIDGGVQAAQGGNPAGRKVIDIEVGEAKCGDVGWADSGAIKALSKCVRADARHQ